jgi:hypothetical protein
MHMADGLGDEVGRIALHVVTTDLGGEEVTADAICGGGLTGRPTVIHFGGGEGMRVISGRGVEPAPGTAGYDRHRKGVGVTGAVSGTFRSEW